MKKRFLLLIILLTLCMNISLAIGAWEDFAWDFENTSDPLTEWPNTSTDTTPGTAEHPEDRFLGQ